MSKPGQRVIVDGISFHEILLFPRILVSITAAMQPGRLVIGLFMVAALVAVGRSWDAIGGATVPARGLFVPPMTDTDRAEAQRGLRLMLQQHGVTPAVGETLDPADVGETVREQHRRAAAGEIRLPSFASDLDLTLDRLEGLRPKGPFEAGVELVDGALREIIEGTAALAPADVLDAALRIVVRMPIAYWRHDKPFTIGYGLFFLVVMTIGGGALARMAACQWAQRERIGVREAFDFAFRAARHLVLAPLLPLILAALLALLVAALGLLLRLPWVLDVLGGLAYGLALLLGGLVVFMILGWLLGLTLLVPAVAVERCDAADAQQRAFAYCLNRPLHRIGYGLVALLGLVAGFVVVGLFAVATMNLTASLFAAWAGGHPVENWLGGMSLFDMTPPAPAEAPEGAGAAVAVAAFFQHVVRCLVPAWVLAYVFTAGTIVYLLMRRACDGQEIDEIWRPGMVPGTMTPTAALEGEG